MLNKYWKSKMLIVRRCADSKTHIHGWQCLRKAFLTHLRVIFRKVLPIGLSLQQQLHHIATVLH